MKWPRQGWLSIFITTCLFANISCSPFGAAQHVTPMDGSHARQTQTYVNPVAQDPDCDPTSCWVIPCDACSAPIQMLAEGWHIPGEGGGGTPMPAAPSEPPDAPTPDMTRPEESACPSGWSLAYTSTAGAPYCGVDSSANPVVGVALWDLDAFDIISFNDSHYWARHLKCYVGTHYTNYQFDTSLIGPDFTAQAIATNNLPPYRASKTYTGLSAITDNSGASTQYAYRVALTNVTTVARFYNVGTAYLVPRRKNCPGT